MSQVSSTSQKSDIDVRYYISSFVEKWYERCSQGVILLMQHITLPQVSV